VNSLPAGLGYFPIYKVKDFKDKTPKEWKSKDYFMPMYQCEALWINFPRRFNYRKPYAAMIGSGNINAVTGKKITKRLNKKQNYLVTPPQPWLDGWKDKDGKIYQFVAADLGSGETVEGQITGEEKVGGIQIAVYEPKPDADLTIESRPREYITAGDWPFKIKPWPKSRPRPPIFYWPHDDALGMPHRTRYFCAANRSATSQIETLMSVRSMGLGRGGQIRQKIYPDPYEFDVWKKTALARTTVHIVNSEDFRKITGCNPPKTPISHKTYQRYGYPWFDLWDKELEDTQGSDVFSGLKPVSQK